MTDIDYSRYYSRWHDDTKEHAENAGRGDYKALARFLPEKRDASIFDFGCGMGFALGGLCAEGYTTLSGIDSDKSQIEAALARDLPVELVPVDKTLENLKSRAASYDAVISLDVLEHIPPEAILDVLNAIRATLRPGGYFICRVPNCDSLVASHFRYNDWTHRTQFGQASLDFVLYNAGFKNISPSYSPSGLI